MAIDPDVLTSLKAQPYAALREQVRDGDLLLCSATDGFSRLIRWATKSPWSHVAIAYRLEEIDRVLVLECVEKIGVRAVPLSSFISRTSEGVHPYPGQILLARHGAMAAKSRRKPWTKIAAFAFDRLGDRFSPREILKIGLRITISRFRRRLHPSLGPKNEFICSEYVARCFKTVGVEIPWDGLGFVAPADIANDPRVEAVALFQT
jgi:Permuted papain-like amidase enzyme, YaeF/YiiX, C92 family